MTTDNIFGEPLEPIVRGPMVKVGEADGFSIYSQTNGVGGTTYFTDELCMPVWDTTCTSLELMKQLIKIEEGA